MVAEQIKQNATTRPNLISTFWMKYNPTMDSIGKSDEPTTAAPRVKLRILPSEYRVMFPFSPVKSEPFPHNNCQQQFTCE